MELTIGDKKYELKFGLSFINAIDNTYTQSMSGVEFGMGVEMLSTYMGLKRPTALYNLIKAGTSHLNSKPSNNDIEEFLENEFSEGRQEELFDRAMEAMEQAPFLKQTVQGMKEQQ